MTEIKEDDIEVYDSSGGFTVGKYFTLSIHSENKEELEQLKKDILKNREIVEIFNAKVKLYDEHQKNEVCMCELCRGLEYIGFREMIP